MLLISTVLKSLEECSIWTSVFT